MLCERYKHALMEAAASGAVAQGELRAHLDACTSCRQAFAQEQSLFAAIDSSLRADVNTEVPHSLLPRLRAELDRMPAPLSRWSPDWFALAGASLVAAMLLVAVVTRQRNITTPPIPSAANRRAPPETAPAMQSPPASVPSPQSETVRQLPVRAASGPALPQRSPATRATSEVLVPRDQELLLASYAQEWSSRKRAPLVPGGAGETAVALLEVPPIRITELDVKPLAEGNSQ